MCRLRSVALFACVLVSVYGSAVAAQDKTSVAEKHDSSALVNSLAQVINAGADLFNKQGDYAGCYRLYQGSLMSVKTFVNPALQKKIEQAIARAEAMPLYSDRAFALREVIDEIRAAARAASGVAKKEEKTVDSKKPAVVVDPNAGQVQGRVTYRGKPAPPGFITFVGADKRRFSASIAADGTYQFKTPIPPGEYLIAIERVPGAQIPPMLDIDDRYRTEDKSGLRLSVTKGRNEFQIDLVK